MLRFGTDGVRGVALTELTTDMVRDLGRAVARVLVPDAICIGRDTRESGVEFERALVAGITAEGVTASVVGVAPTPAIAYLCEKHAMAGVAITASHNPWQDNGIKVFAAGGQKLSDAQQVEIERVWHAMVNDDAAPRGGTRRVQPELVNEYVAHCVEVVGRGALTGLRVVVDCANGAMSDVAPAAFAAAGADAVVVNASPNGRNINDGCGAMHPSGLVALIAEHGADFGIAFDGDGDRLIAVTPDGFEVDGDHLIAMAAVDLAERGLLRNRGVAVTVMTNLGFHRAMVAAGVDVVVTPVGDRSVLAAMEEHDLVLGGEQSGHIIYRAHATTGDGLLAALFLCEYLVRRGASSGDVARSDGARKVSLGDVARGSMTRFPQVLVNVRTVTKVENPTQVLEHAIAAAEAAVGNDGRVLVRASGTEPLIRIMVEAADADLARDAAQSLADAVIAVCGGEIDGGH
jgi:phosphoglucosamine mutase